MPFFYVLLPVRRVFATMRKGGPDVWKGWFRGMIRRGFKDGFPPDKTFLSIKQIPSVGYRWPYLGYRCISLAYRCTSSAYRWSFIRVLTGFVRLLISFIYSIHFPFIVFPFVDGIGGILLLKLACRPVLSYKPTTGFGDY